MSIFTKPLSQLNTSDLVELLTDKSVENARLEFKSQVPDKDETLKKLSSFANTFGGLMIVGAKANSSDGRIESLPGVDVQAGYKQTIVQWCFQGASPPLTVEVSDAIPVPNGGGKVCYVISTGESDIAPHFINGRRGVWIRTDEFSSRFDARLANENELRLLFDRRKQILERRTYLLGRARDRLNRYAVQLNNDLPKGRQKIPACLEISVVPRFPARPLCEQVNLRPLLMNNLINWRQTLFPRPDEVVISQHESAIILQPTGDFSIFEANIWGLLFYTAKIEDQEEDKSSIHLPRAVGLVLLFTRHAMTALNAIGYAGPIVIEVRLSSVLRVDWLYFTQRTFANRKSGSELDENVVFSITTTTDRLREEFRQTAMDLLQYILFSVNLSRFADTPKKLEQLIEDGYGYNFWT
jgi:hypothetical protein